MSKYKITNATTTSVPVIGAGIYDQYLVPSGASGDWSSQAGKIARGNGDSGWIYITLADGDEIFDKGTGELYAYDSTRSKVLGVYAMELWFAESKTGIAAKESIDHARGNSPWFPAAVPWAVTVVAGCARANAGTVTDVDFYLNTGSDLSGTTVTITGTGSWSTPDLTLDVDIAAGVDIAAYCDPQGGGDSVNHPSLKYWVRRRLYG